MWGFMFQFVTGIVVLRWEPGRRLLINVAERIIRFVRFC
jgi:hypothetical protein